MSARVQYVRDNPSVSVEKEGVSAGPIPARERVEAHMKRPSLAWKEGADSLPNMPDWDGELNLLSSGSCKEGLRQIYTHGAADYTAP